MNGQALDVMMSRGAKSAVGAACIALAAVLLLVSFVAAEELRPAPGGDTPAAPSPAAPPREPGVFTDIGEWIDNSIANATATVKGTGEATKAVGEAAKDAVDSIVRLPATRIATGRELCEASPNRTADCERAAEALCRSKGWASMGSLDIQTIERCPPQVWTTGRAPVQGECRLESYVLRAWCR